MSVTLEDARRVGDALRVDWNVVEPETFRRAMGVELEHEDITRGDLYTTGRIVLAHLREYPDYYARIIPMEKEAEAYWSSRQKPSPTRGGTGPSVGILLAGLIVLVAIMVLIVALLVRSRRRRDKEHLAYPPFIDALGHETPVPGDPDRSILRRSRPFPPGRYPGGGLSGWYFSYDPAYSAGVETDYCWHSPFACAGFALEPFRPMH